MHVQEARHSRLRVGMLRADLLAPEDAGPLEGRHVSDCAGESVGLVMEAKGRESKWSRGLDLNRAQAPIAFLAASSSRVRCRIIAASARRGSWAARAATSDSSSSTVCPRTLGKEAVNSLLC